ncbi:MAG: hypothetical protein Q8M69_09080, partial [Reyranella sp.]|nr:hypothetical protein [Reyranella sp.]
RDLGHLEDRAAGVAHDTLAPIFTNFSRRLVNDYCATAPSGSPEVDSAKRLPDAVQIYAVLVAGIPTTTPQADAASRLVEFLQSPRSVALFEAKEIGVVGRFPSPLWVTSRSNSESMACPFPRESGHRPRQKA